MQRGEWAGERLRELLRERAMTQDQLARSSGLRRTDVNRYVRNRQRLGIQNARKIARALDVTADDLGVSENAPSLNGELAELRAELRDGLEEAIRRLERIESRLPV